MHTEQIPFLIDACMYGHHIAFMCLLRLVSSYPLLFTKTVFLCSKRPVCDFHHSYFPSCILGLNVHGSPITSAEMKIISILILSLTCNQTYRMNELGRIFCLFCTVR